MADSTLTLAKQLIACRSVTPSDGGSLDIIGTRLTRAGFVCEHLDRGGVRNLWATHGSGAPVVCLAGHVDVVPPGPVEQWTSDPFTPTERDGNLYGRGSCDMKGGVACMVLAAEALAALGIRLAGDLIVATNTDEESSGAGGLALVRQLATAMGGRVDVRNVEPGAEFRVSLPTAG